MSKAIEILELLVAKGGSDATVDDFVREVDMLRKQNKHKWYQWTGTVNGVKVAIKGFNTSIQIFKTDKWTDSGPIDASISGFKKYLKDTASKL